MNPMPAQAMHQRYDVECAIVGAGVVGLAIARALARAGRDVIVLEAADAIGTGTSSRNSEVIHAGIYYPANSLKARLCVEGRNALYDYCLTRHIPHRRCGKIIVAANPQQLTALQSIAARAKANGVDDLQSLDGNRLRAIEPEVTGIGALLSPSTGIVDSHALMLSLQGEAEAAGAMFAFRTPLKCAEAAGHGLILRTAGESPTKIRARSVVLAAGLAGPALAAKVRGIRTERLPTAYFSKGNYFALSRRVPFSHLIYPVPEPGGLGIHLTLDLAGQARFGPDVEWLSEQDHEALNYDVEASRADRFYASIRRYWPALADGELQPSYSGIRPKIAAPGQPDADFVVQDQSDHGVDGLIALFGIESPGLTASLALAQHALRLIDKGHL
jgi:L-2-hydroxyglutarate oxidase LhgO